MKVVSTTIEYEGYQIKVSNGKVFLPQFGTTICNHNPHWSYIEVPIEKLKPELRTRLQKDGLI
ncbi:MAG: hypothetical protein KAS66_07530 [Candidatus Omnitrophica bacterium]|nr:hypothetical protein [Candidatus Omnitrophota bacterium]